ncbi:putative Mucin-2 [Streptomyces viridochromogenes Tue57]|uniref:Putative Mucin-2 n=1 Tax=Streptomyces viridochromogenes Tue57 TaxID=1160705 RepID=L8PPR3_STRVR|nr:putative Mucin-2 [Streptomyces viridochromogenes Tue57]
MDGDGAIVIVGSITTGYCRSLDASHFASGVTVSFQESPSLVSYWVTFVL